MQYLITEHKLSQNDIAKLCNFSPQAIANWVEGKVAMYDSNAVRFADYLGVRDERLIGYLHGQIEFEELTVHFGEIKTIATEPESVKAWMRELPNERLWDLIEEGTKILRARGS